MRASALAAALVSCATATAAQEQGETYYVFDWSACEQREVEHEPRGHCEVVKGSGETAFVVLVSPVTEEREDLDSSAFFAAASEAAGVRFRTRGPGGVEMSPDLGEAARARFLERMSALFGPRLRVVPLDIADPAIQRVADQIRAEDSDLYAWRDYGLAAESDGAPVGVRFLQSAFDDLDASTAALVSLLRASDRAGGEVDAAKRAEAYRFAHLVTLNYLYRIGRLFPRFNRPMDFAVLGHDLDEYGVRLPVNAEPGDAQYLQVAFLRHLLATDAEAANAMGLYLVALEDLEAALDTVSIDEAEEEIDMETVARLPALIDAFESSYTRLRPLLARQLASEGSEALTLALREQILAIEAELDGGAEQ